MFAGENYPTGVAIDHATGKLYWANEFVGIIRSGSVGNPASAHDLFTGEAGVGGLAIDPDAGKIYWGSWPAPGAVRVANLDGTGTAQSVFTGETTP